MRKVNGTESLDQGLAEHMPLPRDYGRAPEGALLSGDQSAKDRIAVIYNTGDTPPTITVSDPSDKVQTVMANGVAVAIVACSRGPRLTSEDIVLVERFLTRPT